MAESIHDSEFSYFQLPAERFDAIAAGYLDASSVTLLQQSERSRRLLLLRHVITTCRRDPALLGPLGGIDRAQALLDAVQDRDADAIEAMLAYPLTGMWLAHTVRLLEAYLSDGTAPEPDPLWVHLGGVAALASSAAFQAGISFEIKVPVVHGQVLFPGLGRADLGLDRSATAGPYEVAVVRATAVRIQVETAAHRVEIEISTDEEQPNWTPVPVIRAAGTQRVLSISLDHVDPTPSRIGLPQPVAPLRSRWQHDLSAAWRLLDTEHPTEAEILAVGLRAVLPLTSYEATVLGGSSAEGFGAAAIALPKDVTDLACLLVHEFRHSMLNGLLHLVDLCGPDSQGWVYYAPWRDDPRPLIGLLHGAYAFTAVTAFWHQRSLKDTARRAELEFAMSRLQTAVVLDQLTSSAQLTPLGRRMVTLLRERLDPLLAEEVHPRAAWLAIAAARSHRAAWRSHHVRIDPRWGGEACQRWLTGRGAPRPPEESVVCDTSARTLDRIFLLARLAHAQSRGPLPHALDAALANDPHGADQALVRGDVGQARDRYLAEIVADPEDPHPWGGLGPALAAGAPGATLPASSRLLVEHPEWVRAVYRKLRRAPGAAPPDVVKLAGWLAGH